MPRSAKRTATLRELLDEDRALLDAADVIADMAYRVRLNGAERVYASEKLGHAVYKAGEALALCEVELEDVVAEVHRGYRHGVYVRAGAA